MSRLCVHDQAGVGELFDRYALLIFGIGLRVIRDRGEAEEIVQEVFLQLVGNAGKYDPRKGTVKTWIAHLALHKSLDRRSFLTRRRFYNGTNLEVLQDTLKEEEDLETAVGDRLTGARLRIALRELSPKQQITLEWVFFDGCTLREVSDRLGDTLINVRHHFYRGLEQLRKSQAIEKLKKV